MLGRLTLLCVLGDVQQVMWCLETAGHGSHVIITS